MEQEQDKKKPKHKVQAGDQDIAPRSHKVQTGARTCNTESWVVGGEGMETDRGVETVVASGEDKDKEASRDIETVVAGDGGEDNEGSRDIETLVAGNERADDQEASRAEYRGPSSSVELRRLVVRLGPHVAWRTLRG
ncbi:hypothetical protein ILYODFUR_038417 [Ilyodon furcidens]|uniref:Uncharacterized protein n=1 Tax=Ilyodon furcidens TaxID=33524 RepID=A0ABV0UDT9_9TELE